MGLEGVKGGLNEGEEDRHWEMEELGVVNEDADGKEESVDKRVNDTKPVELGHRVGFED